MDLSQLDLTPIETDCIRCHATAPMRFAGLCAPCRAALHERFMGEARTVEAAQYVPKVNVTANAVALKDD